MKNLIVFAIITAFIFSCSKSSCIEEKEILLYIATENGKFDIIKNDFNSETKLTPNPGWDYAPMFDESSHTINYYAYVNDTFKIKKMDLNGNDIDFDAYGQNEYNLSPDGKYIVSQVSVEDYSKLVLADYNGKNKIDITADTSYNGRAKWSGDSKKIAFISDRDGNNEIYSYDLETQQERRLTHDTLNQKYITWSPSTDKLAYTVQYYKEGKPDRNDVFILDLETLNSLQITNNEFNDAELAWSPTGEYIAFHSKREMGDQIYIMNAKGENVERITSADTYHGEPEWATIKVKCDGKN